MTRSDEITTLILTTLKHGPLLAQELADEIDVAPFTVDAYLRDLRRKQLVENWSWATASPLTWRLTSAGENAAAAAAQMRLA